MPAATLTIKILETGQTFTETFDDEMSGVAMMQAQNRSRQLQAEGYPVNNDDDSQSWHSVVTTVAES